MIPRIPPRTNKRGSAGAGADNARAPRRLVGQLGAALCALAFALSALIATAGPAAATAPKDLLDCQFGFDQVVDVQYGFTGTLGVDRKLNVSGVQRPFQTASPPASALTPGELGIGDYFAFFPSTTVAGTYGLKQFDALGNQKRVMHETGVFRAVGPGLVFYLGNGIYGTVLSTGAALPDGGTASLDINQEDLTATQALAFNSCTSRPLHPDVQMAMNTIAPVRLVDTRDSQPLAPGTERVIDVAGVGPIPFYVGAAALNVTAVNPRAEGWLVVYPCEGSTGGTSTVNFAAGETVANAALVGVRAGSVCVTSTAVTDLVIDLSGYASNLATDRFAGIVAQRVLDTREGGGRIAAGQWIEVPLRGQFGVAANATAVAVNVTVTQPADGGYVSVYPCGTTVPNSSNVNFTAGQTIPNAATARLGADGNLCVYTSTATHLVVDVTGYYAPDAAGAIRMVGPARLRDTRESGTPLAGEGVLEVAVAGVGGVPAGALAAALNVTVTGPQAIGYLTVYPCGGLRPWASNVNYGPLETAANHVVSQLSPTGTVCVYSTSTTHVIVDVSAAIVPAIV